jgi:hypothetical protein
MKKFSVPLFLLCVNVFWITWFLLLCACDETPQVKEPEPKPFVGVLNEIFPN